MVECPFSQHKKYKNRSHIFICSPSILLILMIKKEAAMSGNLPFNY